MKENDSNPLGLEDKQYTIEERELIILAIGDRFKPIKNYRTRSHLN